MQTHGVAEQTFEELDFAGQSRSINGTVRHLERAIAALVRRAASEGREAKEVLDSRIDEVRRMLDRLSQLTP
jgi:uncharacterized protein YicC (UPF0701 family)